MPQSPSPSPVGVIGGSGLYSLLDGGEEVSVETPYGAPSAPITVGVVAGRRVAFLPRHGRDHRFPPHRVPYLANAWAMRSLGVEQVLAPCAVGSLRADLPAGSLVVPDQVVDRTTGRPATFYDTGAVHISFADPYCPSGRRTVLDAAADWPAVDGGTMVVISGPRFSSRAESQSYAASGWSVVNMTGQPEATLVREMSLCYTALALVTDLDAGVPDARVAGASAAGGTAAGRPAVTQEEVFSVFSANVQRLRGVLLSAVASLPARRGCQCGDALAGMDAGSVLP